jgi:hypothetical protein
MRASDQAQAVRDRSSRNSACYLDPSLLRQSMCRARDGGCRRSRGSRLSRKSRPDRPIALPGLARPGQSCCIQIGPAVTRRHRRRDGPSRVVPRVPPPLGSRNIETVIPTFGTPSGNHPNRGMLGRLTLGRWRIMRSLVGCRQWTHRRRGQLAGCVGGVVGLRACGVARREPDMSAPSSGRRG